MPRDVSTTEILDEHARTVLGELHTSLPGKVVAYDAGKQVCSVQPTVKRPLFFEDGSRTYELLPIIENVPVAFPRGGGYVVAFPLNAGDPVTLIFAEAATGEWQTSGDVSEPQDVTRHSLGYPVAYPGGYPDSKPLTDVSAAGGALIVGVDGDAAQVRLTAGSIKLGASGGPAVARVGDTVNAGYLVTTTTPPGGVTAYFPGTSAGLSAANTAAAALTPPGVVISMTAGAITSGSSLVTSG